MSRTGKALYNIGFSITSNLIVMVLKFVNRTILLATLGEAYLGISSLFNSVFSILDLAELGIGSAITFSMYKPLAENDKEKVKSLMQLYKKAYIIIGLSIFVLGLLLFPALPYIIKDRQELVNLNVIYMLYLSQTVISYLFFSYKSAIIGADQKEYRVTFTNMICNIGTVCLQGMVLLVFKNFMLYISISIVSSILKNYIAAHLAQRLYPYIKEKNITKLDKKEKKAIKDNIKGLAMYKISSKVLSSTDNIIISAFIGVAMVGKYENYNYFWMLATGVCTMFFNSYTPSIGNLYATESKEKTERFFRTLNFANFWFYGICSAMLYVLMTPFVSLWFGEKFVLPQSIVILIVANFATAGLQNAVVTYKDACGLFYKGRYRPVLSAGINLILSVILVQYWGVAGVVAATIISRMITTWWFDAWLVYHNVFKKSPVEYYFKYWYRLLCVTVTCITCEYISKKIMGNTLGWIGLVISAIITVIVAIIFFLILNCKTNDFYEFLKMIKTIGYKIIRKIKRKKGKS